MVVNGLIVLHLWFVHLENQLHVSVWVQEHAKPTD